ncbi:hypothetical protein [Xylanimonas protaetiae]|uniref:Uncharacterized protein n=1 Tax=Xylanimonas protaetiae TaxID=2509457 RepID=A0A4P6F5G5_9MICO|nr:hypothetical protein [Xylanimonas protaetiae]QAY71200.1 hypothetical protein ET471_15130 [Xylanimonas protaetiae]
MHVGVQFTGTLPANATQRWFTFGWPQQSHVIWNVVSTTPRTGVRQIEWDVEVERASATAITYWIVIRNLSNQAVNIEARYAVLN